MLCSVASAWPTPAMLWTGACPSPLLMGFPARTLERVPMPSLQRIFPTQRSTVFLSPAVAGGLFTTSTAWETPMDPYCKVASLRYPGFMKKVLFLHVLSASWKFRPVLRSCVLKSSWLISSQNQETMAIMIESSSQTFALCQTLFHLISLSL